MLKTNLSLVACFYLCIASQAQTETTVTTLEGKATFGVYGGANLQNINGNDAAGNKLSNSLVPRFHFGVNGELPMAPEFYLQIGIQYISKGTKGSVLYIDNFGTHTIQREIKMNYIEIPVNLLFKPRLGNGFIVLGFGPYVGYCFSGKAKFTGADSPSDADLQFKKTPPESDANNLIYFKPLDMGANFLFGYEFQSGINIVLNSQLGLLSINSKTSSQMTYKNTGFGLALGYRF
jgi:hypothetical protein